jgi:hypothetical protein
MNRNAMSKMKIAPTNQIPINKPYDLVALKIFLTQCPEITPVKITIELISPLEINKFLD